MTTSELVHFLKAHRLVIATVESCTGGLIASQITDIAGASEVFWGSWGVYDNTAKLALGVPAQVIHSHGAVSPETAQALANAGLARLTQVIASAELSDLGVIRPPHQLAVISTTGIAGPAGGTPEHPVGQCFVGIAMTHRKTEVREICAPQGLNRAQNKDYFTRESLSFLAEAMSSSAN